MNRPNILVMFVDEMRADSLGCFGNPTIKTPNLDRLATAGTAFTQCMVTQPTCTPCRASLLTGCFPSALRSRMVGCRTPDDPRFLPRVLGAAGYRTASIGKIHLVPQHEEPDAVQAAAGDYYGFEHVDLVNGHGDRCFGPDYTPWLQERVPDLARRRQQRELLCGIQDCYRWPLPPDAHQSVYIADRAVEYLQRAAAADEPFFLHCSFPDPHHPFTVPEPYASMYGPAEMSDPMPPISESVNPPRAAVEAFLGKSRDTDRVLGTPPRPFHQYTPEDWRTIRAVTAGMVSLLDDSIGRVLAALASEGLTENTIVVFVSDHGDYLGDYGLFGKGLHYDCVIRTPLIMRGPGVPHGGREERIASLVDVAPTLLALAGIEEPDSIQGFSMADGLGDPDAWPRDAALTENDDDMAAMRIRTLTTAEWKLTLYAGDEFGELYDRKHDPAERSNLWSDPAHASTRARLTAALADHMLCGIDGANGRVQNPTPPVVKHAPRAAGRLS